MKKIILILSILGVISTTSAQTSISCTYRDLCDWNDSTQKYDNCQGYDEASLFVMNKDETMFTHTIESVKSTYYVNSKEYDKELNIFTYYVVSDIGNKYMCIFDPNNNQIRMLSISNLTTLIIFEIKAIF